MFQNLLEILPGVFSQFLPLQVMDTIKLSYKWIFRNDVSAEWVNVRSIKVC
jgi:hypothetical protein